jgi:hypothetical protein
VNGLKLFFAIFQILSILPSYLYPILAYINNSEWDQFGLQVPINLLSGY